MTQTRSDQIDADLVDRLDRLRPAPRLGPQRRDAMVDAVLGHPALEPRMTPVSPAWRRPRTLAAGAAVVGLAAGAAVVVPTLVPPSSPGGAASAAAVELDRLAGVAGQDGSTVSGPGEYWYVDETLVQRGTRRDLFGQGAGSVTLTSRYRSWTDEHGNRWRQQTSNDGGGPREETVEYFPADRHSFESPEVLASLPTDPQALDDYLRSTVHGSDSVDEAVFVAVGDMLRGSGGGIAPAALREAAVRVLAMTDHVTLTREATTESGRTAERFDFVDDTARPGVVESIYFDPDTAQVVETSTSGPGSESSDVVGEAHLTSVLPAHIRNTAASSD